MWLVVHQADVKAYKSAEKSGRKLKRQSLEIKPLHTRLGSPGKHMELHKDMDGLGIT